MTQLCANMSSTPIAGLSSPPHMGRGMGKYIATKLHQAVEIADDPFLQRCAELPHFVIDESLLALLERSDVRSSILAMKEAGIARLPFPEMLLELDSGSARAFVLLEEYQDRFRAGMAMLHPAGAVEIDPDQIDISIGSEAVTVDAPARRSHESWLRTVGLCVGIAMLMLNIQGVDRETIQTDRLNRQRAAKGKPRIPTHSVMRIGHVYDSSGRAHSVGAGRHMPVHFRAGHARRQHYGPGNAEVKIVYIPPTLVNFRPGVEITQPKRVLAA